MSHRLRERAKTPAITNPKRAACSGLRTTCAVTTSSKPETGTSPDTCSTPNTHEDTTAARSSGFAWRDVASGRTNPLNMTPRNSASSNTPVTRHKTTKRRIQPKAGAKSQTWPLTRAGSDAVADARGETVAGPKPGAGEPDDEASPAASREPTPATHATTKSHVQRPTRPNRSDSEPALTVQVLPHPVL